MELATQSEVLDGTSNGTTAPLSIQPSVLVSALNAVSTAQIDAGRQLDSALVASLQQTIKSIPLESIYDFSRQVEAGDIPALVNDDSIIYNSGTGYFEGIQHKLSTQKDVKLQYTKEQIQEYIKCSEDVDYFCEKYVKIVSVDKGLVPFKPFEYQKKMFKTFDENRFSICKMPRQVGKTTGVVGYLLHKVLFNENYNIAVLANKERQAREILSRIQLAYEWLPKWMQQGIVEWNKGNIELENGSKILASSTSSSAVRGQSYNLVYLDEFAFVPRNVQDAFFASVFPTISSGQTSKLLITSTPNGMNLFYKIWVDSEEGRNNYARLDVHWSDVPGRDEKWKEETIRNTSVDQFRQEFECEFLGSTNTLVHPSTLNKLTFIRPLEINGGVKVYKQPEKNHVYAMTVDVSEGLGLDASTFVVIDCTTVPYEVVATFADSNISQLLFPTLIHNVGRYYRHKSTWHCKICTKSI